MIEKLRKYIKLNYEKPCNNRFKKAFFHFEEEKCASCLGKETNINEFIKEKEKYSNFQTLLFKMIDERNLKDSDVYNKVHIDRR